MKVLFQKRSIFNPKLILLQSKVIIDCSDSFLLDLEESLNVAVNQKRCFHRSKIIDFEERCIIDMLD